jgi:hypothetical protein
LRGFRSARRFWRRLGRLRRFGKNGSRLLSGGSGSRRRLVAVLVVPLLLVVVVVPLVVLLRRDALVNLESRRRWNDGKRHRDGD